MAMSEQSPLKLEHERWLGEYELRKREIEIKERDQSRSRWSSPVVLAVLAAALAGLSNAAVHWQEGSLQRRLEADKAVQARIMEETKAEAARIFEVIRTGEPDKAATNLKFLVDTGLITNSGRVEKIQAFLVNRPDGGGPALPVGQSPTDREIAALLGSIGNSIKDVAKQNKKDDMSQMMRMMMTMQMMPPRQSKTE
jgi:hypothetical protein